MTLAPRSTPIGVADDADRGRIAAMLARAFADDPAMAYIFPDRADRALRLPRLFALLFDADAQAGLRLVAGGGAAATLWRAPGLGKTHLCVALGVKAIEHGFSVAFYRLEDLLHEMRKDADVAP
ncbi:MAG: ATP-binding protein, partial [Sphingomonas sp.]|uniref:ATP-binding protein n=1 Tax=Sphingomonas sp. TaxID=28214 RepID=UPI0025827ABE